MQLILHIGTAKTGTTSFQHYFSKNRDALKSQGIWYATSLGLPSNRNISICACDSNKPDYGFFKRGLTKPAKHRKFCSKIKEDFDREVDEAFKQNCRYFIISSEHLHSRLKSDKQVHRVKNFAFCVISIS